MVRSKCGSANLIVHVLRAATGEPVITTHDISLWHMVSPGDLDSDSRGDLVLTGANYKVSAHSACPCFGESICDSLPNSTGFAADLRAVHDPTASTNSLTLVATSLPAYQFGVFTMSATAGYTPLFSGVICVATPITFLEDDPVGLILTRGTGAAERSLDLDTYALTSGIQPGSTWIFQLLYRDVDLLGGSTLNTTDGVAVTF